MPARLPAVIGWRRPNLGRPPVYRFADAHAEVNPVNVGFDHAAEDGPARIRT